jgi:hypothetical protein
MFQTKAVEKIKTHFYVQCFFFSKIVPFMRQGRKIWYSRTGPQMTLWRTRFACWISNATDTHSEYVILIALPRQQCLSERVSLLHVYTQCLSRSLLSLFNRVKGKII